MGVGGNYMWQRGKKYVADRAIWKVSLGGPSKALVGTQPPYSTLRGSQKIKIWIFDFFVSIAAGAGFGMGTERELGSGVGLIAWRRSKGD